MLEDLRKLCTRTIRLQVTVKHHGHRPHKEPTHSGDLYARRIKGDKTLLGQRLQRLQFLVLSNKLIQFASIIS